MLYGQLLSELFKHSRRQKNEYAYEFSHSPSEVSRYISGARLPPIHQLDEYLYRNASYFSQAFWEGGTVHCLREIFPVIRDLKSQKRLTDFLFYALKWAYVRASRISNNCTNIEHCELVLQGVEQIQNHILVTLSDILRKDREAQIYLSLSFFLKHLAHPIQPIRQGLNAKKQSLHLMINSQKSQAVLTLEELGRIIAQLQGSSGLFDISLWAADIIMPHPFFYLEEGFVLSVHDFLPDLPFGIEIQDKVSMFHFNVFISQYFKQRISFQQANLLLEAEHSAEHISGLMSGCEAIYAFTNLAFLLKEEHLDKLPGTKHIKTLVFSAMQQLLERPIPMVVCSQTMDQLLLDHQLTVPLLGKIEFQEEEFHTYMSDYMRATEKGGITHVNMVNLDFPPCVILVLKDSVLIYLAPMDEQEDRFLHLPKEFCPLLLKDLSDLLKQSKALDLDILTEFIKVLPTAKSKAPDSPGGDGV